MLSTSKSFFLELRGAGTYLFVYVAGAPERPGEKRLRDYYL